MTVFSSFQQGQMVHALAGPDLLLLAEAVGRHLPPSLSAEDVVGFVTRHTHALNTLLWEGYKALAGADAHPLDGYPPRQAPVVRGMSLEAVEEAIAAEPSEYVVFFDGKGRQIARFGPSGTRAGGFDPRKQTLIDSMLLYRQAGAMDWRMTHNHPGCSTLSDLDLVLAARLNLAEIRAVCMSGVWWSVRPPRGWPTEQVMRELCEDAAEQAQEELYEGQSNGRWRDADSTNAPWQARFNDLFEDAFRLLAARRGFPGLAVQHTPRPGRVAHRGAAAHR